MVGSLIVDADGGELGGGFHARYGGPHAEVVALRDAEQRGFADKLKDATLYVNLEPCSHHGKTPPCADLILEKMIPRVVVAMEDPHPKVAGRGIAKLQEAGLDVIVGVLEKRAKRLNEAFALHFATGRPLVTLKMAQTLDGKIAAADSAPLTITSLESRTLVHRWRSELDAVLAGSGTARADDPQLTVRHVEGRQPVRVVLDRTGELPESLRLFTDEHAKQTVAFVGEEATPAYEIDLLASGGRMIRSPEKDGHLDLSAVIEILGSGISLGRPVQSVLVEAGPNLATALLGQNLVDRLFVFTAPEILGEGIPSLTSFPVDESVSFADIEWAEIGGDVLFQGYLRAMSA